jgi:hypothetical protein
MGMMRGFGRTTPTSTPVAPRPPIPDGGVADLTSVSPPTCTYKYSKLTALDIPRTSTSPTTQRNTQDRTTDQEVHGIAKSG